MLLGDVRDEAGVALGVLRVAEHLEVLVGLLDEDLRPRGPCGPSSRVTQRALRLGSSVTSRLRPLASGRPLAGRTDWTRFTSPDAESRQARVERGLPTSSRSTRAPGGPSRHQSSIASTAAPSPCTWRLDAAVAAVAHPAREAQRRRHLARRGSDSTRPARDRSREPPRDGAAFRRPRSPSGPATHRRRPEPPPSSAARLPHADPSPCSPAGPLSPIRGTKRQETLVVPAQAASLRGERR